MRKVAFAVLTVILVLFVSQAHADVPVDWIHGTVTSEPVSVTYGISVYSFNFQADSSSLNQSSTNLTCLWLSEPVNGNTYNFSGVLISDNSSTLPMGAFLVYSVNSPGNTTENNQTSEGNNQTDWTTTFRQIWTGLGTIGSMFVTLIVQVVQAGTGYNLGTFTGSLIVLVLLGAFFLFLGKHLPWYIDLLGFIVFLAVGSTLFSAL